MGVRGHGLREVEQAAQRGGGEERLRGVCFRGEARVGARASEEAGAGGDLELEAERGEAGVRPNDAGEVGDAAAERAELV